jgi:carbon starvation protein
MNSAVVALLGPLAFYLAYRFYGSFIEKKIFLLGDEEKKGKTPAAEFNDGVDFVPTNSNVLFGHHFSSIAGAAPIVGPAVAAIWGWLPAMLWVVGGVIFMGACHDFGALYLSMKHKGQSMASVAEDVLGPKAKILFLIIIFFLVWMVIAVFALVIANLFIKFPSSVIPVNFEIFIALVMGGFINRKKMSLTLPSILAQITLLGMIVLGTYYPISLKAYFGENELMVWIIFLLIYSFIASTLPVWLLLQPRDYINSHQLMVGLVLMILGIFVTQPEIVAPMINHQDTGAPPWFPFLFITIACGAISGFHGLVSGGTTSKQVARWKDAKKIAYGGMLGEGLLALLATLAVTSGFKSQAHWHIHYGDWNSANGLSAKISAFVLGAGKFVEGLGIPTEVSQTVIAVLIISFAATSLDTACRIQRYIIGECADVVKMPKLKNPYLSSGIAVTSAFLLMMGQSGGKGGLLLWPLFGATNQMLAGLTLILISVYLIKLKRPARYFLAPAVFVCLITLMGLLVNIKTYISSQNWFLLVLGIILLISQLWVISVGFTEIKKAK